MKHGPVIIVAGMVVSEIVLQLVLEFESALHVGV